MKQVTLDNFPDFIEHMTGAGEDSDGIYQTYHYELPVQIKNGDGFHRVTAKGSVTVLAEGAEEPKKEEYTEEDGSVREDEYKVALHRFQNTPAFSKLPELSRAEVSENLHKLITLYSHVYFEMTV